MKTEFSHHDRTIVKEGNGYASRAFSLSDDRLPRAAMRSSMAPLQILVVLVLILLIGLAVPMSVAEAHVECSVEEGSCATLSMAVDAAVNRADAAGQHQRELSLAVAAGTEFEVTAVFAAPADGFHAIGLTYVVPPGWRASVDVSLTDPQAMLALTPKPEEAVYVWVGPYTAGVEFSAVYTIEVPADAEPGLYTFGSSLEYYIEPYPAPSYVEATSASVHVDAETAGTTMITGVVREVDGSVLSGAAVILYRNGEAIANVVSGEDGCYEFGCPGSGDYDLVVTREGFREEVRSISVTEMRTYVIDFVGDSGLIPDAPGRPYVLACVSLWQLDDASLQLSTSRLLDVISASKYPSG